MNADAIVGMFEALQAQLERIEERLPPMVAGAAELDSKYGDPEVKFDPKAWLKSGGQSCKGLRMSQCPSDFLDALAEANEWSANLDAKNPNLPEEKRKYIAYNRKDAARARGWSKRNAGKVMQAPRPDVKPKAALADAFAADAFDPNAPAEFGDDDIGF